jgi:hypothetical protein
MTSTVSHFDSPELPGPVRNASRNASGLRLGSLHVQVCQFCGKEYEGSGRLRLYCDATCRQGAFRARHRQPAVPTLPRRAHGLDVLYECGACGERLLNERLCESCHRFARRLGVAVICTSCDEPILLSELLEQLP